jgi:hypothetical protein
MDKGYSGVVEMYTLWNGKMAGRLKGKSMCYEQMALTHSFMLNIRTIKR